MTMKTTKTTSTILTSTIIALLISLGIPNIAQADHPLDTCGTVSGGSIAFYLAPALDYLEIDGNTGEFDLAASLIEDAMDAWTGAGGASFTISRDYSYSSGDNYITIDSLGSMGDSGYASFPCESVPADYMIINVDREFSSTGQCTLWYASNLEWLATHEFGHTAGIEHTEQWWHSVMNHYCIYSTSTLTTDDADQLDDMY